MEQYKPLITSAETDPFFKQPIKPLKPGFHVAHLQPEVIPVAEEVTNE